MAISNLDVPRRLAHLLVAGVENMLPSGFTLNVDGGSLGLWKNGDSIIIDLDWLFQDENQTLEEKIAAAAYCVLDTLQDFVSERTGTAWPPAVEASDAPMELPLVFWSNNHLHAGYGKDPRINLPPISLKDLE